MAWARRFLNDESPEVVFEALRWIADQQLTQFLPDIESRLDDPGVSYQIFEACLATWNTLQGNPSAGVVDAGMLMKRIKDAKASPSTRAFALRLIDPKHQGFDAKVWRDLRSVDDVAVLRELTRTLSASEKPAAQNTLLEIAKDTSVDESIRADAVAGLASSPQVNAVLLDFAASSQRQLRAEALRSLRFTQLSDSQRDRLKQIASTYPDCADLVQAAMDAEKVKAGRPEPTNIAAWRDRLASIDAPVDREAGRRVFHHPAVGSCSKCHRHSGRGSVVGPDLTASSSSADDDRILTSLLQPSKNVDPQYYARAIMTEDGDVFTGIMLRDGGGGKEYYRDNTGRERLFLTKDIVTRKELKSSLMPDGLIDLMTDREIRDLLAFLGQRNAEDGL